MKNDAPTTDLLLIAIRTKCMDCSGHSKREVETCLLKECPLYPYRSVNVLGESKVKKLPMKGQIDIFELR